MPWCPKCKSEYEEGIPCCNDCDVPLVEYLDEEKTKGTEAFETSGNYVWTFFKNVADYEVDIIESILKEEGIPIFKKQRETGGYLQVTADRSVYGIDLFVPSDKLDAAHEIIDGQSKNDVNIEYIDEINYTKKRREMVKIILWIFFIPSIISAIIALVLNLINIITR
ncbi:MAG: hypothetical protein ACFWUE_03620 [Xylanivirga thermophila]|jgi:hypothetical protein|uniref:hypothetical protein n=1 Tax=Xylanivirga thermophila TaxID=2496273 RepID=UPI0039F53A05